MDAFAEKLLENGFVLVEGLLGGDECAALIAGYGDDARYRSTIDMQRYNFGKGQYRYFSYPLPPLVQRLRETFYASLAAPANAWAARLNLAARFPEHFLAFQEQMRANGQTRPTPLILRYGAGDYNCLHQDINNDLIFPYQMVLGLTRQGDDYDGGHLILTQARPRLQTVAHVVTVPYGGAVIFATNTQPQRGKRGFYRSVFKHGVSAVTRGQRFSLGIVFHDYRE
jgi:hypothetical protein